MTIIAFLQILALLIFAAALLLGVNLATYEYSLSRNLKVQARQLDTWFGDEEERDDSEDTENSVLDYSQLPKSGI